MNAILSVMVAHGIVLSFVISSSQYFTTYYYIVPPQHLVLVPVMIFSFDSFVTIYFKIVTIVWVNTFIAYYHMVPLQHAVLVSVTVFIIDKDGTFQIVLIVILIIEVYDYPTMPWGGAEFH